MDLSQVTLTQMRYAVKIAETESFRSAASQCHVSQSGLSMQIQKLEELLGVVLFDRGKKPVLLTPEGQPIVLQMRAVLRETERLGQVAAEGTMPSGRYRLGVIPSMSPSVVPLFLKRFVSECPAVELILEELKTEEILARLENDTLDAGIAATPLGVSGLQERALAWEPMLAYLPLGDALLKKSRVSQSELAVRDLWVMPEGHCFRSQVLSYCEMARRDGSVGPKPVGQVFFESGNFETLIRLVDDGMGATVLPALVGQRLSAAKRKAQLRPLTSPTPVREIGLVTARAALRRRVTEALAETLQASLATALKQTPTKALVLDPLAS